MSCQDFMPERGKHIKRKKAEKDIFANQVELLGNCFKSLMGSRGKERLQGQPVEMIRIIFHG